MQACRSDPALAPRTCPVPLVSEWACYCAQHASAFHAASCVLDADLLCAVNLVCRAADVVERELLTGSGHLKPLDLSLAWIAKTNADLYLLACLIVALLAFLPFVMVPILVIVAAGRFVAKSFQLRWITH